MDVNGINRALASGGIETPGLFPHLEEFDRSPFQFAVDFGLKELPGEPGLLIIRGARQYGKSTWLEGQVRNTIRAFGPASAFYLNGDEWRDTAALVAAIRNILPLYDPRRKVRRLFIDEITAVPHWEKGLKLLLDAGELRDVLVITTGSKAVDLRRGGERLPGRKGRLARSHYLFTPISYANFHRACGGKLGPSTLPTYLLSGGSPPALRNLAEHGHLPEHVVQAVKDWVFEECAISGRPRASLLSVMDCLCRRGGSPLGQLKLAREAGLANNSVAAGYIELLSDLLCVATSFAWDNNLKVRLPRYPAKYHFINLLAASVWHLHHPRTADDIQRLPPEEYGRFLEWMVAQELFRRAALRGDDQPEIMSHWRSKEHELDFVINENHFIEVKAGRAGPLDFAWFPKIFPQADLTVVCASPFQTNRIHGISLEEFLLQVP